MSKRGFASMTKEQHRAISSKGGKTTQDSGKALRWVEGAQEPKDAGRKGGRTKK